LAHQDVVNPDGSDKLLQALGILYSDGIVVMTVLSDKDANSYMEL
jgi:hypothetical protein